MLLVVFFFGDRNWLGWTPDQRILLLIRETKQDLSSQAECYLQCYGLTEADMDSILVHGDVLLGESNTKSMPRQYIIESHKDFKPRVKLTMTSSEKEAHLIVVKSEEDIKECPC